MKINQAKMDANQAELMARLEAKIDANQEKVHAKIDANQERMDAKTDANLSEMKAEISANSEKFEFIQSTLIFQMDIHPARTLTTQAEMKATVDVSMKRGWRLRYTPSSLS
jgi:hypothetical protein